MILNATPYNIIGIGPRGFKGTISIGSSEQVWIPTSMEEQVLAGFFAENFHDRRLLSMQAFGRLKPGIGIKQAEASLQTIASRLQSEYPKDNAGRSVVLTPLADTAVGANNHDQFTLAGATMLVAVGLVLLIACANLANLLLAQAARREKEMTVRAALGAGRGRLLRQLLTESTLLSLAGAVVGLGACVLGTRAAVVLSPLVHSAKRCRSRARLARPVLHAGNRAAHRCSLRRRARDQSFVSRSCRYAEGRWPRQLRRLAQQSGAQPPGGRRNRARTGGADWRRPVHSQPAECAKNRSRIRVGKTVHDGLRPGRIALQRRPDDNSSIAAWWSAPARLPAWSPPRSPPIFRSAADSLALYFPKARTKRPAIAVP